MTTNIWRHPPINASKFVDNKSFSNESKKKKTKSMIMKRVVAMLCDCYSIFFGRLIQAARFIEIVCRRCRLFILIPPALFCPLLPLLSRDANTTWKGVGGQYMICRVVCLSTLARFTCWWRCCGNGRKKKVQSIHPSRQIHSTLNGAQWGLCRDRRMYTKVARFHMKKKTVKKLI